MHVMNRMRLCANSFPLLLLPALLAGSVCCRGQAASAARPRVVLIIVPGLRAEDLTMPELAPLAALRREGAAAWMVCRAGTAATPQQRQPDGRDTDASLLLTLNT